MVDGDWTTRIPSRNRSWDRRELNPAQLVSGWPNELVPSGASDPVNQAGQVGTAPPLRSSRLNPAQLVSGWPNELVPSGASDPVN